MVGGARRAGWLRMAPCRRSISCMRQPAAGTISEHAGNVRDSDATLLLTIAPKLRGGTGLTAKVAERLGKPYLHICLESKDSLDEAVIRLLEFISRHDVSRLNVAGPRASQEPEIGPFVDAILSSALLNNASISTDPTTHRL